MFAKRQPHFPGWFRLLVALTLLGHLLFSTAMALYGPAHELAHVGAHDADHECAATLFASGSVEGPLALVLDVSWRPREDLFSSTTFSQADVQSVFLAGSVFEHAPPVLS